MNISTAEILLIASTIGGAIAWLLKFHSDKSKENKELGKIDSESWGLLRGQVKDMEKDIVALRNDRDKLREELDAQRERIDVLEGQVDMKDATIKRLESRLTKILVYLKGLFRELNERGVQYTPPEPGLMDTDPNIPSIKQK